MSEQTVIVNVDPVSLATLGGSAEAQFRGLIDQAVDIFTEADESVSGNPFAGGDVVKAKITIVYEIKHKIGTGTADASTSMRIALPSRRGTTSPLMLRGGRLLVEEDMQEALEFNRRNTSS